MKLINAVRNWWNPYGFATKRTLQSWKFTPTNDITAYELYMASHIPIVNGYKTFADNQTEVEEWYKNLPPNCKKYLTSHQIECKDYHRYGE